MLRSGRSYTFRRAIFGLCLALFVPGFVLRADNFKAAQSEQYRYFIQRGTPAAIPNFIDISAGCNWSGIGGQVFDQTGSPVNGWRIKVSGTLDGRQVLQYVTTGSSQRFGSGGFELKLGDRPVASQSLILQLFDAAGTSLSSPFILRTFDNCQQNLLVVNLIPISIENVIYLPQVSR